MIRRLHAVTVAGAAALLMSSAGCAHAPPPHVAPQLAKADLKFKEVYVEEFTIAPAGVAENDPKPHLQSARAACILALKDSGLFDTVNSGSAAGRKDGVLIARAELTSLRIVGGGARFWLGVMAGRSAMRFRVSLVDAATGAAVTGSEVGDDTTWGGAFTIGARDHSLPERVGTQLAEFVALAARR
jgi:hypothetical protein